MRLQLRNFYFLFIFQLYLCIVDGGRSRCKNVSTSPPSDCPTVVELVVLIMTSETPQTYKGMPEVMDMIKRIVAPCNLRDGPNGESSITFITDIRAGHYNWTVYPFAKVEGLEPSPGKPLFLTYANSDDAQYDMIGAFSTVFVNRSTHSAEFDDFTTAVYIFTDISCTLALDSYPYLMDFLKDTQTEYVMENLTFPVRLLVTEAKDSVSPCRFDHFKKVSSGYFDYQINVSSADHNLQNNYGFCSFTMPTGFETTFEVTTNTHLPATTKKPKGQAPLIWGLGSTAAIFGSIFLICFVRHNVLTRCRRQWFDSKNHRRMSEKIREIEKSGIEMRAKNSYKGDPFHSTNTHPLPPKTHDQWEVDPDHLLITEQRLGSGAYAVVHKAMLSGKPPVFRMFPALQLANILSDTENMVAAKTPKKMATQDERIDFLREIDFMKKLDYYPHLLSLIGCSTSVQYPVILTEFCALGDLLQLVRTMDGSSETPNLTFDDLVPICWQMSDALSYLETRKVIHRDVAARNVLVTKEKMAKLSDFGLCRTNEEMLYTTKGGKLPLRWMAPESIDFAIFTAKTDVWSYGILLYEVFSFGKTPFMSVDADNLSPYLNEGNRLFVPEKTPLRISAIMTDCWRQNPDDRPEITVVRDAIYSMMEAESDGYGYLTFSKNYYSVFRNGRTNDIVYETMENK